MTHLPTTPFADYPFYRNSFGGSMSEADFDRYIARSTGYLDAILRGDVPEEHQNAVKFAACAAADFLLRHERGISSEENGDLRVTYLPAADQPLTPHAALAAIATHFLGDTGLLYLGV